MKLIIQPLLVFYHKCHMHLATMIYIFLALIAGQLTLYLLAMVLVIIHELCHFLMAYYFNYSINEIEILPFGAFLSLDDIYDHPMIEEACVILAGPCSHICIYFFIVLLPISKYRNYLISMNDLILLFNLLPIYPLDGSRLISLILQSLFDLKTALYDHLKLSIFSLCILSVFYLQYQTIIIIIYLFFQQFIYYHHIPTYLRLCYLHIENNYAKMIIHDDLKFRRGYNNYYSINNHLYHQQQMLFALLENV